MVFKQPLHDVLDGMLGVRRPIGRREGWSQRVQEAIPRTRQSIPRTMRVLVPRGVTGLHRTGRGWLRPWFWVVMIADAVTAIVLSPSYASRPMATRAAVPGISARARVIFQKVRCLRSVHGRDRGCGAIADVDLRRVATNAQIPPCRCGAAFGY